MPRPSRDRVMVSFYLARSGQTAIRELAAEQGMTQADVYRTLLKVGLEAVQRRPALLTRTTKVEEKL